MLFPFEYAGVQIIDTILLILGIAGLLFMFLIFLGVFIVIFRNYGQKFWQIPLRYNLFLLSLFAGVIIYVIFKIVLITRLTFAEIADPVVTIWALGILMAIAFGAVLHSSVTECGTVFAVVFLLVDSSIFNWFSIELLASMGLLSLIMYLSGPYISNRFAKGMLNYSISGVVLLLKPKKQLTYQQIISYTKKLILEDKSLLKKYKIKKSGAKKQEGMYALANSMVTMFSDIRVNFIVKGETARPVKDALAGKLNENGEYLPCAMGNEFTVNISSCMDSYVTIKKDPVIHGALTLTDRGPAIVLMASEETTTKRYVSIRARRLLLQIVNHIESRLKANDIVVVRIPEQKDEVIIYQWAPYYDGGESQPDIKSKGNNVDSSRNIEGIIWAVDTIKKTFFVEDLWEQLRKAAVKKIITSIASLILAMVGIGV